MNSKINVINPDALIHAISKLNCGEAQMVALTNTDFEIPYDNITPLEGYEIPEGFPGDHPVYRHAIAAATDYMNLFPACCDKHKRLPQTTWFDKKNYEELPSKVVTALSYTEYTIQQRINTPEWYTDITNYFEYVIRSFGQLPEDFGCTAVGLGIYEEHLKMLIKNNSQIPEAKRNRLIAFFEEYHKTPSNPNSTDLNLLVSYYQKWLKIFPFGLSYFKHLKGHFESQLPVLKGKPEHNPYSGWSKAQLLSNKSFMEFLVNSTSQLLSQLNGLMLVENGLITDVQKVELELINESRRLELKELAEKFDKHQLSYVKMLKRWFEGEKKYFREIKPLLTAGSNDVDLPELAAFISSNDEASYNQFIDGLVTLENYINKNVYDDVNADLPRLKQLSRNLHNWLQKIRSVYIEPIRELEPFLNEKFNEGRKNAVARLEKNLIGALGVLDHRIKDKESSPITSTSVPDWFEKELARIGADENKLWKGVPMSEVVRHFRVFAERESRNKKPFLTQKQLIHFLDKGFLGQKDLPKLKFNLTYGEKGFIIKRFYEFFCLAVTQYNAVGKKFPYIQLVENCFDNWNKKEIEHFFKPGKTKDDW